MFYFPIQYYSIFPDVGDYVFDPKDISRDPAAPALPPKMGYFEKTEKEVGNSDSHSNKAGKSAICHRQSRSYLQ